jgi:hypothetical protein
MLLELLDLEKSNATPLDNLHSKEYISGLLKAGSLISMIENKKINTTTLFLLLLETPCYQDFFTEITASENFKQAILSLLYLHPNLVKSKITKSVVRKINAKSNNRSRKTPLQQASCDVKKVKKQTV